MEWFLQEEGTGVCYIWGGGHEQTSRTTCHEVAEVKKAPERSLVDVEMS